MRIAIATFPRSPGERRIEVDRETKRAFISFYTPRINLPPRREIDTPIRDEELDATIDALVEARAQLRGAR
jgi:hypothetical protein